MDVIERVVEYYFTADGNSPFHEWLNSLKDANTQKSIDARLARLRVGNFGDCVPIGDGVYELRIHMGAGYRIYFGQVGHKIVLLLWGGVKKSQSRDIIRAKMYWNDYWRQIR